MESEWIRLERRLERQMILGAAIGAYTIVGYFEMLKRLPAGTSRLVDAAWATFGFTVLIVILAPVGILLSRRLFVPTVQRLEERVEFTAEDRRAVLHLPVRVSRLILVLFLAVAVFITVFLVVMGQGATYSATVLVAVGLAGLAISSLSYLLVERALRPALARVLEGQTPEDSPTWSLRRRLLDAWALGSAIPLSAIIVAPAIRDRAAVPLAGPVILIAAVGLLGGWVLTRITAQAIADPLGELRAGLASVAEGELEASVPVSDGGQLGAVQAAFNQMVVGLRERERLADLLGRHVGTEVAAQALAAEAGLNGETRQVSVFFVDMVGSSGLADRMSPDEVVATLNRFFAIVVAAVEAEGGWVNKFEGDGALCVFGAPNDQLDHAERAIRSSRRLRGELKGAGIDAGIGVSSGHVIAGNVGTEQRYEYTVIGIPIIEAARLTELAKRHPARLMASASVLDGAPDGWDMADEVELRGLPGRRRVYVLA